MKFNTFRNAVFLALLLSGSLVAQDLPSPYSYDPSWGIDYSDGIFRYYPRDMKASTYKIPASIKVIEERAFQFGPFLKCSIQHPFYRSKDTHSPG